MHVIFRQITKHNKVFSVRQTYGRNVECMNVCCLSCGKEKYNLRKGKNRNVGKCILS